jgi:hypothetical protein
MALTLVQQCRTLCGDLDVSLPLLDDATYEFYLERNNNNVNRASVEAARTLLFVISQRTNETVDVFSISGSSQAAEQYRKALLLFIKDPLLNPIYNSIQGYAGGQSKADFLANNSNLDNIIVQSPAEQLNQQVPNCVNSTDLSSASVINPFLI